MISPNYVNPVTCDKKYLDFYDEKASYYEPSVKSIIKHPHMRQAYQSLSKIKKSFKTFLFERRDHQEKRPQDGKTNPME